MAKTCALRTLSRQGTRSTEPFLDTLPPPRLYPRSIAEDLRQWGAAAEHLGELLSAKPAATEQALLLVRLGTALRHKGDLPGSVEAYEKALKLVRGGAGGAGGAGAPTINRIKALMSESLYLIGARDAAVSLVMTARPKIPAPPRPCGILCCAWAGRDQEFRAGPE